MLSSSQKIKGTLSLPPNSSRISVLRSKFKEQSGLAEEMDCIVEGFTASMEAQARTTASLESLIKNILSNLKQAFFHPTEWIAQASKGKQKQFALLLESKLSQFQQIYQGIASNSLLVDALTSITCGKEISISFKDLPISNTKRQLLAFYKEASQYYQWRKRMSLLKDGNQENVEEALTANPQLKECSQFRKQVEERGKMKDLLDRIGSRFGELEEKLLGFALQRSGVMRLQDIQTKLSKLQDYVQQSYQPKSSDKVTPKSVKEHSSIVNILTLLANSNAGLLQQSLATLREPIKSICTRLLQNITRNNKGAEAVYEHLLENINERATFRYARSVKQLPLDKKIAECERLIKQIRQNPELVSNKVNQSASKQAKLQQQLMVEALNSKIMEGDNRLLLAEQQIYTLQTTNQSLQSQNVSLKARILEVSRTLQLEKERSLKVETEERGRYDQIVMRNRQLHSELQGIRQMNNSLSEQLVQQQHEIMVKDEQIRQLTTRLHKPSFQILPQQPIKSHNCMLQTNTVECNVQPCLPTDGMEEVITLIQDAHLMGTTEPFSPPRHKQQRSGIKHSRSLSNVDFLSELLPEIIERDLQNESVSATTDIEQLKRGIQLRQKTIKKYEVYMDKQRKEAKRHRAQILELQTKIRALEMEKIKLQQVVQDQSSQKLLQLDGECGECRSLVQVEECQEISSIQKIAEKEEELKVKQEEINFKIEEIIKHVLKLNTLRVSPHADSECAEDGTDGSPEASTSLF